MTVIKSIRLKGFKSFSKLTEIPFSNGFSCIIGPNGSGKTNVSDGICFVLGKMSARSLRADKSANLIHNGGKKGKPSREAQVDVVFDNSKKEFAANDKEVKITRIVRHSGNSIYKLNEKPVTRQQVIDMLNSAAVNPDGHNIVLQGDIARFMEMKPVERREILEEIAGISMYEEKKHKAINELAKVEAKLKEANVVLTERDAHLRELKKERDQALKYRELEKSIKDNKATYLNLQIKDKTATRAELEDKAKKIEHEINSINSRISQLKKQSEEDKKSISKINEEVEKKGEIEQKKLHEDIEDLKTSIVRNSSRIETCASEVKKLNARKESLEKNLKEVNEKVSELNRERLSIERTLKLLAAKEREIDGKTASIKKRFKLEDVSKLEKDIEKFESEVRKLSEKKQALTREKDKIEFEISNLKIGDEKELGKVNKIREEFKNTTAELTKALNENSVINSRLSDLRRTLVEENENLARLRSKQLGIKAQALDNLAMRKILESKEKGIYGAVSDLGRVSNKYSLALGIAAGPRTKSIVVEDDVVAARCIKYLKDNKLGVVTFLPLNKIKARTTRPEVTKFLSTDGVKGLAIDLISFDNKFRNIFSYVFTDTLIVDNISTARHIGIGNVRMVTLEGDLLETSGAMIGGYRKRAESFREKETEEELSKAELKVGELSKNLGIFEKKRDENEELVYKLKEIKAELEGEIIKYERIFNVSNLDELKNKRKDLAENSGKLDKEIKAIEADLNKISRGLEELKSNRKNIRLDSRLEGEFSRLEKERQGNREEIIRLEADMKNIDVQVNDIYLKELDKTKNLIKENERESSNFNNELNMLQSRLKKDNTLLKEKENVEKRFYAEFKNLFSSRNKLNEAVQKRETLIIREEEKIKGLEHRNHSISIDKAKIIAETEALNKEFEEFVDAKIRRNISLEDLKYEIKKFEGLFQNLGAVNLRALEVYENVEKEYKSILEKVDKLKSEKEDVLNMMAEIDSKKKDMFMKTFRVVNKNFRSIFSSISTKGEAHLELEDEDDIFSTGMDIKVRIVGNKFLDVKGLSGGEKTLAALALIFSIQEYQPASFYLFDEVDAALDKTNSELLSKLLYKYSRNAQYIVISHNDAIIGEADQIYGVSMQNEISKIVSLKI